MVVDNSYIIVYLHKSREDLLHSLIPLEPMMIYDVVCGKGWRFFENNNLNSEILFY